MRWGSKSRVVAAVALLGVLSVGAAAQKSWGDLHASADGRIETLYNDAWGNVPGTDEHSLGLSGQGMINGDYYNPNFLSFSVLPYYGRSQDNSESQSITNASGYNGTVNIFGGSHFPGFVDFNQTWNNSGTYGLPLVTGLATVNNSHEIGVGWSELVPGFPTLSATFSDTDGTSSLLGSATSTASATRIFNLGSAYNLDRYYMIAGFTHLANNVDLNGLEDTTNGELESETVHGSSNQYRFMVQGPLPYRRSNFSMSATRNTYSTDDSLSGTYSGTTDTINGNANLMFPKAPVSLTTVYTDNLLGSVEQQLVSNGQVPLTGFSAPESRSIMVGAETFVNVLPRLMVGGYVNRTQQFFAGQSFGLTQIGFTASYNFVHRLKGLTVFAGANDNNTDAASQANTHLGFVGNVNYNRYVGKWQFNGNFLYNQNTQTYLVMYTTSTLNYGGTVKRQLTTSLSWAAVASVVHSGFEQVAGSSSKGESFTTMLIGRRASLSGVYSKSSGVGVLTSTGIVSPTTVPAQLLGNQILFNGNNYGANVSLYPIKHLIISTAWSKSFANTNSAVLLTNSGNTNYYGFAAYEFRKLIFQAGATKFTQSISNSGVLPSMLTSYTFGVQRWFKGF